MQTRTALLCGASLVANLALSGPSLQAQPRPATQPAYTVRYSVQPPGGARALLAGEGELRPSQPLHVSLRDTAEAPSLDLSLEAHPERDGSVSLMARWTESDRSGRRLVWDPQLRLARGHEATASVTWGADARVLTLSVR